MSFFKLRVSFPLNFASPFSVMTHNSPFSIMTNNSSEIFQLKHYMLCTKKAHECTIFQTFESSNYKRSEGTSSVVFEVNRFYEFVHLQLFDDVKLLFSEIFVIFRKQKRTAVYKSTSLVLDFKLTRENDNLLSLRYRYRTLCTSILKCRFSTEGM